MISFKKFNWFCQNVIGIKYAKLHRIQKHCDGDNLKKSRYIISLHLLQFIRKKFHLIFYDSSSLCQSNFKNSVWTLKTGANRKHCMPVPLIFGSASILMACTTKKIINFWITTKNNKLVTTSFLFETIHKYRKEFKNKVLVIFLDNAKMHYSEEMKLLAEKLGVYLFFNAAYSSKINLVEYVFEKIKRRIRHRLSKQLRVNLKDMLFKE